jgi:hypothetical protein
MKLGEKRFSAILDGTATDLKGQEILVRNIAYEAERLGHDPRQAVEYSLPFLTFVDDVARITIGSGPAAQADTGPIPPLEVLLENARRKNSIASAAAPRLAAPVKRPAPTTTATPGSIRATPLSNEMKAKPVAQALSDPRANGSESSPKRANEKGMSFFKRLGRAAKVFGQEMNKGSWITNVKQEAWSLDRRSQDWHQRAPDFVTSAVYDKLWEEMGQPSMHVPRKLHVRVQTACACWVNGFFSAYHDRVARGESVDLNELIDTARSPIEFNSDFTPKA